jgi:hypothetical protein
MMMTTVMMMGLTCGRKNVWQISRKEWSTERVLGDKEDHSMIHTYI